MYKLELKKHILGVQRMKSFGRVWGETP